MSAQIGFPFVVQYQETVEPFFVAAAVPPISRATYPDRLAGVVFVVAAVQAFAAPVEPAGVGWTPQYPATIARPAVTVPSGETAPPAEHGERWSATYPDRLASTPFAPESGAPFVPVVEGPPPYDPTAFPFPGPIDRAPTRPAPIVEGGASWTPIDRTATFFDAIYPDRVPRAAWPVLEGGEASRPVAPERTATFFDAAYPDRVPAKPWPVLEGGETRVDLDRTATFFDATYPDRVPRAPVPVLEGGEATRPTTPERTATFFDAVYPDRIDAPPRAPEFPALAFNPEPIAPIPTDWRPTFPDLHLEPVVGVPSGMMLGGAGS